MATAITATVVTYTNAKDGRTVQSSLSHTEAGTLCERRSGNLARDLADRVRRNLGLSPTQLFWLHTIANEVREEVAQQNIEANRVANNPGSTSGPAWSFPVGSIVKFLDPASQHRKSGACVTFTDNMPETGLGNNGTVQIKRIVPDKTRNKSIVGHYYVSDGKGFPNSHLYGRITPAGDFIPHRPNDEVPPAGVLALLDEFQNDPVRFIQQYGVKTGRCCFCTLPLDDPNSAKLGYGPICAAHYNLPHGPKAVAAYEAGKPLGEQKKLPKGAVMASDLGWSAGEWPEGVAHKGLWYRRDAASYDAEGDCESVQYVSGNSTLIVYND